VLLGRTFAGIALTSWIDPPVWSGFQYFTGLRIENLTVYIMAVFNTVGNRAIMIGIALGVVSTSLKILLGLDRSIPGEGMMGSFLRQEWWIVAAFVASLAAARATVDDRRRGRACARSIAAGSFC
jgi:hypothetical protein